MAILLDGYYWIFYRLTVNWMTIKSEKDSKLISVVLELIKVY